MDKIQKDQVICSTSQTIHTEILSVFHTDAAMTVITASRKACNHINDIVPKTAFTSQETIAIIDYDNDLPPLPLYKSMSHHHQKQRQTCWHCQRRTAVVQMIQTFNTIILKLPNDKLVHIYPVTTTTDNNDTCVVYPFTPAYTITICKAKF